MPMLLKDLADERNRHGHQPRKHQYEYEPDLDAPWHQQRDLLPMVARCETCAHWAREVAGACGITLDLGMVELKRAEDRCTCWCEHQEYKDQVVKAAALYPQERMQKYWETRNLAKWGG